MFSLRDSSSASSSGTDEDSFGWWIGVEAREPSAPTMTNVKQPASMSSKCTLSSYEASSSDEYALARVELSSRRIFTEDKEVEAEYIELCSLADGSDEDNDRRPLCYTPERLIRCEDYRILTPSPRFYPTHADLSTSSRHQRGIEPTSCLPKRRIEPTTTDGKIGATRLATLLQSPERGTIGCRRCCSIEYGNGEVLLRPEPSCPSEIKHKDLQETTDLRLSVPVDLFPYSEYSSCCGDSSHLEDNDDCSQKGRDQHRDELSYTTEEEVEDDKDDKLSTKSPSRLSDELTYVSFEYNLAAREKQKENTSDINEVVSILADLDSNPSRTEALLQDEDRFRDVAQSNHDCLARLALAIEPDGKAPSTTKSGDPEAELEQLRDKVERLQGSNKDLYEEITSLRRDFTKDEWKMNHLSDDINKLRNEVYELRYLDDLLKLLKGELERVSNRNWPFAIGHTKHGTEEINLVV